MASNQLNQYIKCIPGDAACLSLTFSYKNSYLVTLGDLTAKPDLTFYGTQLIVVPNTTSLDSAAIISITLNSGKPDQGNIVWIIEGSGGNDTSLLARGTTYWFRAFLTDLNSRRITVGQGKVFTGA